MGESHEIIFAWRNWHKPVHATGRIPPTIPYTSIMQGCFAWVTKQDPRATYISADIPKLSHTKFGEVTNLFLKKATELTPQPCARQFPSRFQQRQKLKTALLNCLTQSTHVMLLLLASRWPHTNTANHTTWHQTTQGTNSSWLHNNHIVFHRKRTFYIEGSSLLIKFSSRWHIFCQFAT